MDNIVCRLSLICMRTIRVLCIIFSLFLLFSVATTELVTSLQFQASYGKPLLAAKDAKCSAKDAEAGVLAMEALHKQVFFFLSI